MERKVILELCNHAEFPLILLVYLSLNRDSRNPFSIPDSIRSDVAQFEKTLPPKVVGFYLNLFICNIFVTLSI